MFTIIIAKLFELTNLAPATNQYSKAKCASLIIASKYVKLKNACIKGPPKSALYIIVALVFRIIVNKKKSVTYCQQVLPIVKVFCVHKVFIALFVEYPLCFLLCHDLRLHMLKTCSIGKTVLSVSCARLKSHICKLRHTPPPHFKTKKSVHLPLPEP